MNRRWSRSSLIALLIAASASAQPIAPIDPQERAVKRTSDLTNREEITQAIRERIKAVFLTEDERDALRIRHGLWSMDDLEDPNLHAQIAFGLGHFESDIFEDDSVDALIRAQHAIEVGNPSRSLTLIDDDSIPSLFVRAQAHELLGETQQAITDLEHIEQQLADQTISDPHVLATGARALIKLTRLRSPATSARADYEAINTLIAHGRDRLDRLDWEIRWVEATLLYEHHNLAEAHQAAIEALKLNPQAAAPIELLGHIAVDGFDLERAETLASMLDQLTTMGVEHDKAPMSIGGAMLRARIALRRKDPTHAEFILDPLLSRFPDHPELRALEVASSAAGYRVSSTDRLLARYDELFPNSPAALMTAGTTLAEYRQYDQASSILERAIERAPNWGEPKLQLGLMLVQAGEDLRALDALTQAQALDPFNLRATNSIRLLEELQTYETIETEHFIIRYKAGPDEILAKEMPEVLEEIHTRVTSDLPGGMNHEPDRKTIIELMPNHEWFAVRIGGMPSIHTMAASTGPVIAFESPREGPKSSAGEYDWARVLQHEYTHTVNLSRTRNRVIHWMTEANAVYNEDAPRDERQWEMLLKAFQDDKLFDLESINIAFVRPKEPGDRSLAYAQGAWMFAFLIERFGEESPRSIMDASSAGRSAPEAFEQILGITPDAFMSAFIDWARQDLISRGLLVAEDLPTLSSLLADGFEDRLPTSSELDEFLDEYPDHPEILNLKLGLTLALNQPDDPLSDDQVEILEQIIVSRPIDEMPHRRLAKHYLSSDVFSDNLRAIPHLEFLDVRSVTTPVYADQLAELYARTGEHTKALDKAIRATRIAPFDARTREQAARFALIANLPQQAIPHLEALITIEPDREIHTQRLDAIRAKIESTTQP